MSKITRRTFLKQGALAVSTAPFLDLKDLERLKQGPPDWAGKERVSTVTSVCRQCYWGCLIVGKVKDGIFL